MHEIRPQTKTIRHREQNLVLSAMLDAERIEWVELQVLAARDTIKAIALARRGNEEDLRQIVTLLVTAEYSLVRRATGWSLDRISSMTKEERQEIVKIQDGLNKLEQYTALMAPFAEAASIEALTGE